MTLIAALIAVAKALPSVDLWLSNLWLGWKSFRRHYEAQELAKAVRLAVSTDSTEALNAAIGRVEK